VTHCVTRCAEDVDRDDLWQVVNFLAV
jgi:hypothetical protein